MKEVEIFILGHKLVLIGLFVVFWYQNLYGHVPLRMSLIKSKLSDEIFTNLTLVDPMMTSSLSNFVGDHFEP